MFVRHNSPLSIGANGISCALESSASHCLLRFRVTRYDRLNAIGTINPGNFALLTGISFNVNSRNFEDQKVVLVLSSLHEQFGRVFAFETF